MKFKKKIIVSILAFALCSSIFVAGSEWTMPVDYNDLQRDNIAAVYADEGEDAAYDRLVQYMELAVQKPTNNMIQEFINHGLFSHHIEELKALGFTSVDYSPVTGGSKATAPTTTTAQPAATPKPFTVEVYKTPVVMKATANVNYREGASTSYKKLGIIKKNEEVQATGVASTGWYEVTKADGTKVYVSNKYLKEKK